jgi:phosphoribosyl 1,2-cyclic phosphodiesterase
LWGTRGSISAAGVGTVRYGGETSCVEVRSASGQQLILDAGSGIRELGAEANGARSRFDVLLTHLHMDHIVGLGFFAPLFDPDIEVNLWGPASSTAPLGRQLTRYLSPPLFPVVLRDLPRVNVIEVGRESFEIGPFRVRADFVCHPGATLGYRVEADGRALSYLPDHEPALGARRFPEAAAWTSGLDIAEGVDLLIHDAQYAADEYEERVGWGHSTTDQALAFATLAAVGQLCTFHHDPSHSDEMLTSIAEQLRARTDLDLAFVVGREDEIYEA